MEVESCINSDIGEEKAWAGVSMDAIYHGKGPWNLENNPISPSKYHAVMFQLPTTLHSVPKPHHKSSPFTWKTDYVRMPFSSKNVIAVKDENGEEFYKPRWEIIETSLLKPILNTQQFEEAVFSYHDKKVAFTALHSLFEEHIEQEETIYFFRSILPSIIQLALQLPVLLPGGLPLLKQNSSRSISLSQHQISSLLANAFLCTFPWHKDFTNYPEINFNGLYETKTTAPRFICVIEKLKSLCHYFRRVCNQTPCGVVTFKRKSVFKSQVPRWDRLERDMSQIKLHISSTGTIEDNGLGLLQVDFANSYVGGGVLRSGCVQEEIRFIICPELILSRLFTERLGSLEALVIYGVERYSNYSGYGNDYSWDGDYQDQTPFDTSCRRKTSIVAIDALHFQNSNHQYESGKILRELNKAFVGFYKRNVAEEGKISAVATGNWGCGAYRGDPYLKSILQMMACVATYRDLVYFTFGNKQLQDDLYGMHIFLATNHITVAQLWRYLCQFSASNLSPKHLYSFIQQAHLDSKKQPSIRVYAKVSNKASTSSDTKQCDKQDIKVDVTNDILDSKSDSSQSEVVPCSQEETALKHAEPISRKKSKIPVLKDNHQQENSINFDNHDHIVSLMDIIDGKSNSTIETEATPDMGPNSLLTSVDELTNISSTSAIIETYIDKPVDKSEDAVDKVKIERKLTKISDYFNKLEKK